MLTLTIPGGPVQLSGNRVQCEVETDTITGEMYKLLLKTTSLDESFPEGIDALDPNDDDKAIFDIRNRVTLPLVYSFTWPLTAAVYHAQPQMAKKVALDIGERFVQVINNENVDTVNWSELESGNELLILKGRIPNHLQAKYNEQSTTFYQQWIAAGKFLTTLPDNLTVSPGQPVKLWYIPHNTSTTELTLQVYYVKTDGTDGTLNIDVVIKANEMTELDVGAASLGLNPTEISNYSVVLQEDGISITETRSFRVDNSYYEYNYYILFANIVGGIDCIWFHGNSVKKAFPTTSEKSQRDARITDTQQRPTIEVDYKSGKRKWTLNYGYRYGEEEMKALTGLYESRNVWLLDGNDIIPVMTEDGDNEYFDSMKNIQETEVIFTEAH